MARRHPVTGQLISLPRPMSRSGGGRGRETARLCGADVAGLAPAPEGVEQVWVTHVRVASVEETAAVVEGAGGTVPAEPIDLPPAGRLVVFNDPAGAGLCGFEPAGRRGAQRVNEPGAWAMSLLSTPDPEGALAFYGAVFGWRAEAFGDATLLRLPGYVGGEPQQPVARDVVAALVDGGKDAVASWGVDLWTHDAEAAVRAAITSGGRVLADVQDARPFRRAVLADPGDAVFSVSQLVAGA